MEKFINIDNNTLAIKTSYDKAPSKLYDETLRPDPEAVKTARANLSADAFTLYSYFCDLPNRAFIVVTKEVLANKANLSYEAASIAIEELINKRYLNYTQVTRKGTDYVGNTFKFIPDNSLVAVVPAGYIAKSSAEYALLVQAWKKPYFFVGKVSTPSKVV